MTANEIRALFNRLADKEDVQFLLAAKPEDTDDVVIAGNIKGIDGLHVLIAVQSKLFKMAENNPLIAIGLAMSIQSEGGESDDNKS